MKTKQVQFSDVASHFVDSHNGIYSGQIFALYLNEDFNQGLVKGINAYDWQILLTGPNHEDYIEVWAEQLDSIEITDSKGQKWSVYENEGIFLYPKDANINWDEMDY